MELRRILAAVDLSDGSRDALEYAVFLGERCGAQVDALHVWQTPDYVDPGSDVTAALEDPLWVGRAGRRRAELELDRFVQPFVERGARIGRQLQFGKPAAEIVRFAAHGGYDLIVLGTRGRTGLARVLLGSVATTVVREATVAVLVARPSRPAPSEP